MLTRLEHSLLSTTIYDWEPLHILYKETLREFKDVTFTSVIEVLVKLFNSGYIVCTIEQDLIEPVTELDKEKLLKHYGGGLSEKEMNIYPDVVEYYFKATTKGREEAEKDIYNTYYPD